MTDMKKLIVVLIFVLFSVVYASFIGNRNDCDCECPDTDSIVLYDSTEPVHDPIWPDLPVNDNDSQTIQDR